jgi:hypothetical protein
MLPRGMVGKGVAKEELIGLFYVITVYALRRRPSRHSQKASAERPG